MAGVASSNDGDIGFQIAPMVDVVFVLMLFFMASAGMQVVEKELMADLVSPGRGTVLAIPVIVQIASDGQVSMNTQPCGTPVDKTLQPLRDSLKNVLLSPRGDENPVIIKPASDVRQERIMDVLSAINASQGEGNLHATRFKHVIFGA